MIGQFQGRQKTNVYGWVSDLAVARSGFNQIGRLALITFSALKKKELNKINAFSCSAEHVYTM